jgi:ribose transport system substrate-binding protein
VDLIFEHQGDDSLTPIISAKVLEANIPLIAIHIPHPGAIYFGPDHYTAGVMGGRYLGLWAKEHWNGDVDEIVLLEYPRAGVFERSRLTGTVAGVKEILPDIEDSQIVFVNGQASFIGSLDAARKYLRRGTRAEHTLISGVDDSSTIGGIRAFEEAGRAGKLAALGHGGSTDGRTELRRSRTPMIATVAYFPERYGEWLISLGLQILSKATVSPAMFIKHQLITMANVEHFYPTDSLRSAVGHARLLSGSCGIL